MGGFSRALTTLSAPDYMLMRRVHRWRAPRWVQWWMLAATRAGDGWFWGACGMLLLAMNDAGSQLAFMRASLAAAAGILTFYAIKKAVGRKRPCTLEPHCWSTLLPPDQFSFPSGHSITAFAVATSLALSYPALMAVLLFCALSVAVSRIVLGMHFLSDVLVGALLGTLLGYGAFYFVS